MKFFLLIAVFVCSFAVASSWNVTVGTGGAQIVPQHSTRASAWSTNAVYTAGTKVSSSNKVYWSPNGGTPTVEPSHSSGVVTGVDSVTWVRIPRTPWNHTWVSADINTETTIAMDETPVAGTGYLLDVLRPRIHLPEGFKGSLYGIVESGTATIKVTTF